MGKTDRLDARLSRLRGSLAKMGEELKTAGERIRDEVGAGVDEAMLWTEFTDALSPVIEAAPGHTMRGADVQERLDDPDDNAPAVIEARARRRAFVETRGLEAWNRCLGESGTLKIERYDGRTTITRLTP